MKALPEATFVDVREDGVPGEVLRQAHETFGAALLNTRSTTWRGLSAEERDRPVLELLDDYPTLMKRPLIRKGDALHLGWSPEVSVALQES